MVQPDQETLRPIPPSTGSGSLPEVDAGLRGAAAEVVPLVLVVLVVVAAAMVER